MSAAPPGRARRLLPAVGVLGELLITGGVLIGLFVVWQLWWTDVTAGQEQQRVVAELGWPSALPLAPGPTATGTGSGATTAPTPGPVQHRTPPPTIAEPAHATTFAVMYVPRWGAQAQPISEGTSTHDVLNTLGIGHYEHTAMPGAIGNFAVAGHRTTYGKPFHRIAELEVGDPVVVRTSDTWYVYRVTSTQVVAPTDVAVIAPVPDRPGATPTEATMTMTTCHPMYSGRERFVVHLVLDYWTGVTEGTPVELAGPRAVRAQGGGS